MIEDINWNYLCKCYGGNNHDLKSDRTYKTAYDMVGEYCLNNYTKYETILLYNFIVEKRNEIKKVIMDSYDEIKEKVYLSDDLLWDLAAHIIGLGESMYELVKNDPKVVISIAPNMVENFEYGFTKAIYEYQIRYEEKLSMKEKENTETVNNI